MTDARGRPLRSLRISVTDRCNLRCRYCMPEREYAWLPRRDLLGFEEIDALVGAFVGLGVARIRLTGGEPLVRRDLPLLIRVLADGLRTGDLALTTNGILLGEQAQGLVAAGLQRVTVSLDSLRADRFEVLTRRRGGLARVLAGIEAASRAGFRSLKINCVVIRGVNDDEMPDLLAYGSEMGAEVRFIEYMDVGGATRWSMADVVPRTEILIRLGERYGAIAPGKNGAEASPAERFVLPDGTCFGIVASTSRPFCGACDRVRLTADGMLYPCLYARSGTDLRGPLRNGATRAELQQRIARAWRQRRNRGAEQRLRHPERGDPFGRKALRRDPHLEMHTRGG